MCEEEVKEILKRTREYTTKILKTQAKTIDKEGYIPKEIIKYMGENALLGAIFPKEYGGLGFDALQYGELTEIIGKVCSSTRTLLTVSTSLVGETILKLGSKEQKNKYLYDIARGNKIACFALSESEAGSNAKGIKTRYEKKNDKFIINGDKKWISFAGIADIFLVIARNEENKVSAFILEKNMPGITVKPMNGLLGGRGSHVAEINFDNVEVLEENLLCIEGSGFSFVVNTALYYGRYSIAWAGLAIAQAGLEEMVSYSRKRKQFGKNIGEFQLIQGIIADSLTKIHAARALCENIGRKRIEDDEEVVMQTNIAKYFTSTVAQEVATNTVQVLGGNGCYDKYPAERLYREAKVLSIIEGSSQIQQIIIGKYGINKYKK